MNGVVRRVSIALAAAGLLAAGCVERIMKIRTSPPGAIVTVNDEEVGVSPLKVAFLWYGDYDIVVRKEGYQTLKTQHRIDPPWYQLAPFDIVAELLIPGTIRDERELPLFELAPAEQPTLEQVVERAEGMRSRALAED